MHFDRIDLLHQRNMTMEERCTVGLFEVGGTEMTFMGFCWYCYAPNYNVELRSCEMCDQVAQLDENR